MSNIPDELKYTRDHVWVQVEGDVAVIGVTDYAQEQLGDILFVTLPEADEDISAGDVFTELESSRTTLEAAAPVSGTIIESNEELDDSPELINEDAYENWIVKVKLSDDSELDELLSADEYEAVLEE
ncbi:MAG: glycine cleavage system protein GcvH [Lachnospiraceae bacterium]|nr:glycine cleavage system protein GcvH [Lachnospiraceae bacterium]MDY4969638.1 glycine cleavage system protein GcvH [Lachnospiraceae bacterium]